MNLSTIDAAVVLVYTLGLILLALWISREKSGHEKNTDDYFLASNSLPWWAIGASLIAANISAEQIIGMSGSGYAIGLAIASYEWMAAITLIIVGKYCLPIFLQRKIYTIPQFLENRYDHRVRTILAVFWLGVYIFVNLTAVLWLGALAIKTIAGVDMMYGMLFLACVSVAYSLYGGLKAIAMTDIVQIVVLVLGGLILSYICLDLIGEGKGILAGFNTLTEKAPEKFDMILSKDNPHYVSLPGLSVLLGGMWIMNFSYWGFNQYIIQRALAAKSIHEAQKGIAFAAYLKLLMPIIVVLPGIAAVILAPQLARPDEAYPVMMQLMPVGLKGLVFAALIAAVVSSLGSMTNSISTIFTMDLYAFYKPNLSQKHYVFVGRAVSLGSLILAILCAKPLLGDSEQAFQFIQEFTGFFTPGICVLFMLGMFWKKATANGALCAAFGSLVFSIALKYGWATLPFMDRVGVVFLLCLAVAIIVSILEGNKVQEKAVNLGDVDFKTQTSFKIASIGVICILIALYTTWW